MPPEPRLGPPTVLLVTPDYPPDRGGIQRLLSSLVSSLRDIGHRVLVSTPDPASGRRLRGVVEPDIVRFWAPSGPSVIRHLWANLGAVLSLRAKADIVICGHLVLLPASWFLARIMRVPLLTYVYGKEVAGRPALARFALAQSAAVVAVSQYTADQVLSASNSGDAPNLHVIHPGVHPDRFPVHVEGDVPSIITIARLRDWYKGHDVMLEAMKAVVASHPDAVWHVIGEGPLREELAARVCAADLGRNVKLHGSLDDSERDALLSAAHVFSMPARYPEGEVAGEGFPVVYLEAAAAALPAVAGRFGGPAEAVLDRRTGVLVDPASVDDLAAALNELLDSPELRLDLGTAARMRVEREFTWTVIAGQVSRLIGAATRDDDGQY